MCKEKIQYNLEYSKRKTVGIVINESGEVIVKAPIGVSRDYIDKVIEKKKSWIQEKVSMFKEREQLKEDEVMYLGKVYRIKVVEQKFLKKNFVYFENDIFIVNVSNSLEVEKTLEKWFREECYKKIKELMEKYIYLFKVQPKEVKVKQQKRKW